MRKTKCLWLWTNYVELAVKEDVLDKEDITLLLADLHKRLEKIEVVNIENQNSR